MADTLPTSPPGPLSHAETGKQCGALRRFFLVLAISVLLTACGGGSSLREPSPTATSTSSPTTVASPTEAAPSPTPPPSGEPSATPAPQPSGSAQVIRRGPSDRNVVVLTFDAGSDTGYASQILDTLAANRIVAAFGMTGQWAERNPALLQRMVNEGHELINHTYDHGSFTGYSTDAPPLTQAQRWNELERAEAIVQQIAGVTTKPYFRPPYGDYDDSVNADVYARGYTYNVMWTVDSMGWNGLSADAIVERCLAQAAAGAIYIFHVGSASQDAAALQRVIDGLRAAGYTFVPLSAFAPR